MEEGWNPNGWRSNAESTEDIEEMKIPKMHVMVHILPTAGAPAREWRRENMGGFVFCDILQHEKMIYHSFVGFCS